MSSAGKAATGPLVGLRVIELGAFIAGPYCGQILADMGAEVIKVEPPGVGDPMRAWGVNKADGRSLWWPVIGRNKKCITLDLRRAEAQGLARRLVLGADVLVENFRPGTLEGWNLHPDVLRQERPELIVARVSGFGQTGPYRERPGFAAIAEAMAGLRALTGYADRPPTRVGLSLGDSLAGLFAALGIVTALYSRQTQPRAGMGQSIDIAITDSVLAIMESVVSEFGATGKVRARAGTSLPGIAPSNIYPTSDGSWVLIAANADSLFRRLAEAMGKSELLSDARFADHQLRGQNQVELDELIGRWTSTKTREALQELLVKHEVPVTSVYDASDVTGDPHFRSRGAIQDVETEDYGRLVMQGVMPRMSDTPGEIRWAGPRLGEHNDEVFGAVLGLSDVEISNLRADGTI